MVDADAEQHGEQHQQEVLLEQVAHRERDPDGGTGRFGGPRHHQRYGHERDQAAECRERNGQRHVAAGELGEDIGRTAARATGDQDQSEEENGREPERAADAERDEGQQHDLAEQGQQHRLGGLDHPGEILKLQAEAQVKHQDCQNR